MQDQQGEEAIALFCSALDKFHRIASGPHKDTHIAQEALRSCIACAANVFRTPKSTPQNVIVEDVMPPTESACTITEID